MKQIACWTQESTPDESLSFIKRLALSHALEGGEQGEYIANCIVSGNLSSLCDFDLSYENTDAHHAGNCRQALAYFTKYEPLDLGRDKRAVAKAKFMETEQTCALTNDIFRQRAQGSFNFEPWVEAVLHRAQSKIARILGECPKFEQLHYRFGPGATTLTKKSKASTVEKLQAGISCSEDLLPWASRVLEEMPHLCELHATENVDFEEENYDWGETPGCDDLEQDWRDATAKSYNAVSRREAITGRYRVPVLLEHGVVDFVPKNAKTMRTIVKEASLNTMCQAALGDLMFSKLHAFGIDLKDQSRNQRLALQGSLDGSLATLDLSSASDTIATELVFNLLPIDWALMLSFCRSSKAVLDGQVVCLEKFSSMGNGFTFPLESLIFWALTSSASDDGFASVYGDDIIVSTASVDRVMRILQIVGFTLNSEKSFWTGPFRESCGADYIRGIDIRPIYQKKLVSPMELYRLSNEYYRRGDMERCEIVRSYLNPCFANYGPDGYGDGHLVRDDWLPRPHKKWKSHGYGGAIFETFKLSGVRDKRALRPGDRVLPLYTTYIQGKGCVDVLPANLDVSGKPLSQEAFLTGIKARGLAFASEPIPERVSPVDGAHIKCVSLPGTKGYHSVSIYTFETGR